MGTLRAFSVEINTYNAVQNHARSMGTSAQNKIDHSNAESEITREITGGDPVNSIGAFQDHDEVTNVELIEANSTAKAYFGDEP